MESDTPSSGERLPLLGTSLDKLSKEARELLDPTRPLPAGHLFLPRDTGRVVPPAAWAVGLFGIGVVFASGLLRDEALVLKGIYGVVAVAALLAGVVPARRAVHALRRRRALSLGQWRRGLHVLPDGLLQWDGLTASWVPRGSIEGIRVFGRTEKSRMRRTTVVEVRVGPGKTGNGKTTSLELPEVPAGKVGEDDEGPDLYRALVAWVESGEFRPPTRPVALGDVVRSWTHNILMGHGVMTLVGLAGLILLTAVAQALGRPAGALLGLLLGVPVFLGFPALLHRLARRRLIVDSRSGRVAGWGYQMVLGLAALFIFIVGGETAGTLWWQLRAEVHPAATLTSMMESAGSPVFHRWPNDAAPSGSALGHYTSRFFLGDSRWVETTFYVAPLVGNQGPQLGCVWLGLETREGLASETSKRRLLQQRTGWLVEAAGLEQSGYGYAVEDAMKTGQIDPGPCRPLVVEASPSRGEAILASQKRLALLFLLVHSVPLLLLGVWALVRWDRLGGARATGAE